MFSLVGSGLTPGSTVLDGDDPTYNLTDMFGVRMLTLKGVTYVYVTDSNSDGISVFRVNADGSFTSVQHFLDTSITDLQITGAGSFASAVVDGVTYLYSNDIDNDRINTFSVDDDTGMLTFVSLIRDLTTGTLELDGAIDPMHVVSVGGTQFLIATGSNDDGFTVFSIGAGGALTEATSVDNTRDAGSDLDGASGVSSLVVGGKTFLLVAAFNSDAINVFELAADGSVTFRDAVRDSEDLSLELDRARGVATATVGGTGYVFVSGGSDDGIAVFSLAGDGTLTNVFNLDDTEGVGELGLNGVQGLQILTFGNETFLTAMGTLDDAVSYFSVAVDGSLTLVDSLFDTPGLALNGANYSDTALIGERLWLVTGGTSDNGLSSIEIGGGADVLVGELGDDELYGFGGDDILIGGAGNDTLFGHAGNDRLFGNDGNDTLVGGLGNDIMEGRSGDDIYFVDSTGDTVIETANGGIDTVYAFADALLAANVENGAIFGNGVSLTGNALGNILSDGTGNDLVSGGDGNDTIYGQAGNNTFLGGEGNDVIVSGSGIDVMNGGAGDDSYFFGTGDVIMEAVGGGIDVVYTTTAYTMSDNVEIAVALAGATAGSITGNSLDNTIISSTSVAGSNFSGGAGNDTIYLQASSIATGGADSDVFVANGAGNTLFGGTGDDVFILAAGASSTTVLENSGQGNDIVYSSLQSYTLPGNVEVLVIQKLDGASGRGNAAANTVIGNAGADFIFGDAGGDLLIGGGGNDFLRGGEGLDVLQGNTGADRFHWAALNETGDIIQDFVTGEDKLSFDASAFTQFSATLIEGVNFISGAAPVSATANATFLWDTVATALYFDADGTGAGAAILIADLQAFSSVTVNDIVITNLPEEAEVLGEKDDADVSRVIESSEPFEITILHAAPVFTNEQGDIEISHLDTPDYALG